MTVKYETGTKNMVIDKRIIADNFFILSSGLAGEILQKFINYGVRCAIYGDYSHYTSKPLNDFFMKVIMVKTYSLRQERGSSYETL